MSNSISACTQVKLINEESVKQKKWGQSGKKYYPTSTSDVIAQLFSGTIRG